MKRMKKALSLALAAAMLMTAAAGCNSSGNSGNLTSSGESGNSISSGGSNSSSGLGNYPNQNVNVIVQYSAGGGTDLSVRGVLDGVPDFPVNFSVANVTGNGGLIGLTQVANSTADGYTLGVVNTDFIINIIQGNTDLTLDDFSPLACALMDPFVLIIGNNENYSTLEEFVAYAKEHPGEIVVGETGTGAAPTLAISAMENALGIDVSNVTYEGSADCVTAIVGGHIDATFAQPSNATAQVEAGNVKIIGALSNERLETFPDVPTFAEVFPDEVDYEMMGFCIISCPAGVDSAIQEYLSENLRQGVDSETFSNTLDTLEMQTENLAQEEMTAFLEGQMELYTQLLSGQA